MTPEERAARKKQQKKERNARYNAKKKNAGAIPFRLMTPEQQKVKRKEWNDNYKARKAAAKLGSPEGAAGTHASEIGTSPLELVNAMVAHKAARKANGGATEAVFVHRETRSSDVSPRIMLAFEMCRLMNKLLDEG